MNAPLQVVDRVHMWGHEMLTTSDQASGRTPASSALLAAALTDGVVAGQRVLLVGPHDPAVLSALVGRGAEVEVVLRSWIDASELAERHHDVRVHCGGFDRFEAPVGSFDVVLAPDGMDRLWGPDSQVDSWPRTLERLLELAGDGWVEVGVRNELTEGALWTLDVGRLGDDRWPLPEGASLVPPAPAVLTAARPDARVRSLYPHLRHPLAVVPEQAFERAREDPRLRRVLVDAFVGDADRSVLRRDPRPLVDHVLGQRLGQTLAPGWLVRLGGPSGEDDVTVHASDVAGGGRSSITLALTVGDGEWTRRVGADGGPATSAGVARDVDAMATSIPPGRTVEEAMLDACAAHDLAMLRRLVREHLGWLEEGARERAWTAPWDASDEDLTTVVGGDRASARLDDVLVDGHAVLDAGWRLDWEVPLEVALAASLVRFSDRLVSSGARHPFAPATPPAVLARSLAAMAGHVPSERSLDRAASLLEVLGQSASPWRRGAEEPIGVTAERPWGSADFHGLVELDQALAESNRRLQEAQGQVEWLLLRVVREDRRRRAMMLRAKEAERRLGWRLRLSRRIKGSRVVRAAGVLSARSGTGGGRWSAPTGDGLASEVDEVRDAMRAETREGTRAGARGRGAGRG